MINAPGTVCKRSACGSDYGLREISTAISGKYVYLNASTRFVPTA